VRVCYLVQSHREPRQILRLVHTLKRLAPESPVLVAHDSRGCALEPRDLGGAPDVHFLRVPGPIRRGYLSMLDPYLLGIERLRELEVEYDWLVYLSGQDYPTQPLARSEAMLAAADSDGFIRFWPALAADTPWGRRRQGLHRYGYRYREAPAAAAPWLRLLRALNGVQSFVHVHLTYGPRVGTRRRRIPLDLYGGWQWTTLRRACAELVSETVAGDPELVEYYRRSICPDESLVQTVLVSSGRFRLTNDNLRYADNRGSRDGRPRVLGVGDLDLLTAGGYHFARKFDLSQDARVLDALDERLEG
jgi:hypothetical protein